MVFVRKKLLTCEALEVFSRQHAQSWHASRDETHHSTRAVSSAVWAPSYLVAGTGGREKGGIWEVPLFGNLASRMLDRCLRL